MIRGAFVNLPGEAFQFDLPLGVVDLPFFGCPGGGIIPHKSLLPIDDWPSNNRFHSNLTSKSDSPGQVLFCAPGIWSKSEKIINFRWFYDFFSWMQTIQALGIQARGP